MLGLCLGLFGGAAGCGAQHDARMDAGGGGHAGRPGTGIGEQSGPCGFGPPCDPQNLAGLSCEYFLRPGGTLGCDPSTCRFDLTGCAALPPGPGAVLEDAGR